MLDGSKDSRRGRLQAGVILSYVYSLTQIVINLLYVPLLLSGIGRDEYGLYQLIGSIMSYMVIMNSMFSSGVTRYYCKYLASGDEDGMESTLYASGRIYRYVSFVAVAVVGIAALVVRRVYSDQLTGFQLNETSLMLGVLVINLIVTMHNTISIAVISAHERFAFLKVTQLVTVIAQPVFVILLIGKFPYATVIPVVQLFMNILCALVQRYYSGKVIGAEIKSHDCDDEIMRGILTFSGGIVLAMVADQVFWKTNQLILGYHFGMGIVATYGIASQIYMIYMMVGNAIPSVFMPKISELYNQGRQYSEISNLFIRVGRICLYPLLLVLTGFFIFGEGFIGLWAGADYGDAYYIALIIMVPFTIDLVQNIGLTVLQVENKYAFRGRMYLAVAIANIIAVALIAPQYGAIGAALCSAVTMMFGNGIIMNIYYHRQVRLDIPTFWKETLRESLPIVFYAAAIWFGVAVLRITFNGWVELGIGIVLYAAGFFAVAMIFSANEYEKWQIRRMIEHKES